MEENEQSSGMSVATSRMAINEDGELQKDMLINIPEEFIESPDVLFLGIKVDGYKLNINATLNSILQLMADRLVNSEYTDSKELILLYEREE